MKWTQTTTLNNNTKTINKMNTVKEQIEKLTKELDNFNYTKDEMFMKILNVFDEYEKSERMRKSKIGKLEYLKNNK